MPRARFLHVLAPAPVAVLLTAALLPCTPMVQAASVPPADIVCIDPGHGGRDPGAIGLDGLVEKDLTLDISERLAALLRADGVTVVLTRTSDATVSIQQRSDIANASHADVFLPIYFNSWATTVPDGSVVLYPYARDLPFAQAISQAVTAYIGPYGDSDGGVVHRPDWWLQPTMPVATVESLFISNPHDAALLTQPSFRQGLAEALKNGIEAYLPGIMQRQQELQPATSGASPPAAGQGSGPVSASPPGAAQPRRSGAPKARAPASGLMTIGAGSGPPAPIVALLLLLLIGGAALGIRHRRRLVPATRVGVRLFRDSGLHRRVLRRRRRLLRERASAPRGGRRSAVRGGDEPPAPFELEAWPQWDELPEAQVAIRGRSAVRDRGPLSPRGPRSPV